MCKRILAVLLLFVLLMSLSGCKKLSLDMPQLTGSSTLTGKVEAVDGNTCTILVTEGDKHFDAEDQLYLTYVVLDGAGALRVGNHVRFSYSYTKNVSEKNDLAHITVQVVTLVS